MGMISICLSIQQTTGAQRPYRPVNVAFAKVWKFRSNPTSAAEAASFLASGSLIQEARARRLAHHRVPGLVTTRSPTGARRQTLNYRRGDSPSPSRAWSSAVQCQLKR
jgi:hypothetical protein